jgi:nicotinamidase-related amidase
MWGASIAWWVLSKTSSSPFNTTAIDRLLRSLGIDTLLVCGVVTNGCVEGTVRDASDLGYQVIMVDDACAAVTPALHQAAITNLKDAFCNCRDTDSVVQELNALAN